MSTLAAAAGPSSAPLSGSASLPSSHPVSRRIRAILAQPSRNDANLNAALDTLASLYSEPSAHVPSAHPAPRSDFAGPSSAVSRCISTSVDTERARRDVGRDARNRVLKATDDFIAIMRTVDAGLERLNGDVQAMYRSCDDVGARLDAASGSSSYLVEHAEGLQKQRQTTELQRSLSGLFLEHFTLSESEREAIHDRQVRVGSRLFAAMDHLDRIRRDCRILLEGSDAAGVGGGTRAGMDIMSATAEDLDLAYQKIYKWCTFEFRQPVKEGLEVSRHLREAVRRLFRARQDLLRSALSTLVQTRSSILTNAFVSALTIGGPAPTYLPRPIELHAHDPLRYVGDMLAWIHQTLASEREFLTALFGEKEGEGGRRIGQRRRGLEGSVDLSSADPDTAMLGPGEAMVREVLNRNLEGCCRPLKIRVQQTVRSQEGSVTTYRLAHLVQFYRLTMEKTIGSKAVLSQTLKDIADISTEAFYATLDRQAAGLSRFEETPEPSLTAPPPLVGVCSTLKELMAEYQRSLADLETGPASARRQSERQKEAAEAGSSAPALPSLDDFDPVLDRLVGPMLDLCERMAEGMRRNRPRGKDELTAQWEAAVFLVNCLGFVVNLLQPYSSFTAKKLEEVQHRERQAVDALTDLHYKNLHTQTGLSPILSALSLSPPPQPLSHHAGTTPEEVAQSLGAFNAFLSSSEVVAPSRLGRLSSPRTKGEVHAHALRRITDDYDRVVLALRDERNRYEWNRTLVRRTTEEVRVLLLGS